MFVFLNGRFVPASKAVVSVFDRSFLYGDGLFETMRVSNGKPFRWDQHMQRLKKGAAFLRIRTPFSPDRLHRFARHLVKKNRMPDSLLRLTLSRGVGVRGYSPKDADQPTIVMSLHAMPGALSQWKLMVSSFRLPAGEPLAQFKTCNKLAQVLARAEADAAGADEALLLNTDGSVVEGATSNLFWIERKTVCTPPLATGILAGVTRAVILEICRKHNLSVREKKITPRQLARADGVFLSLSSYGIVEARSLDGKRLKQSPLVARLAGAYDALLMRESH